VHLGATPGDLMRDRGIMAAFQASNLKIRVQPSAVALSS
jgi:hypothetical protein